MPFGMVSGVGRGIGVLDGSGDRRRERGSFGMNLGRLIVTNGDFVAYSTRATRFSQITFGEDLLKLSLIHWSKSWSYHSTSVPVHGT